MRGYTRVHSIYGQIYRVFWGIWVFLICISTYHIIADNLMCVCMSCVLDETIMQLFTDCPPVQRSSSTDRRLTVVQVYTLQCLCALGVCLGGAGPLLTLSWHSFPHYISSEKGMYHTTPPHRSKWGVPRCCGLIWETTNMKISNPSAQWGASV